MSVASSAIIATIAELFRQDCSVLEDVMCAPRVAALVIVAFASVGPALALEANQTMAAWQAATADEKSKLVTEELKQDGQENATARVIKCLDAAAAAPGHADLPIRRVVKACAKTGGEPI